MFSRKESHLLLETNGNQTELLPLNLSQNRYIEDQYDRFGKQVAGQLGELPLRSFVVLQEKIQSLLTNERLHCLNTPSPLASYVSSVITSPSELFTPCEESDASFAANVT
jgi:hypothetical protein